MKQSEMKFTIPTYLGINYFPNLKFTEENTFMIIENLFRFINKMFMMNGLTSKIPESLFDDYKTKCKVDNIYLEKMFDNYDMKYFKTHIKERKDVRIWFLINDEISQFIDIRLKHENDFYDSSTISIPKTIVTIPLFNIIEDTLYLSEGYIIIGKTVLLPGTIIKRNECKFNKTSLRKFKKMCDFDVSIREILNSGDAKIRISEYLYLNNLLDRSKNVLEYIRNEE